MFKRNEQKCSNTIIFPELDQNIVKRKISAFLFLPDTTLGHLHNETDYFDLNMHGYISSSLINGKIASLLISQEKNFI